MIRPAVSAVVINFNGGKKTLRCLEALSAQTCAPERIVVVDNGSHHGETDRIRDGFPQVEVIELGDNLGLPAARNVGLASVDSELVLLVDNDIYPEPDALERLLDAWIDTRPVAVCPRIRLIPQRDVVQADGAATHFVGTMVLRHGFRDVQELPAERSSVPGCVGACYLLDRLTVVEAGGYDELFFFYFEDLEFMLRLSAAGHDFVCEPSAEVYHDRGEGTPGLSFRGKGAYPTRRAYLSMRHRWLTILIHYRWRTLFLLLPALALYEMAVVVFALTRGWGLAWLRAWVWQARNLRTITGRRRVAQRSRTRSDRELLTGGPVPLAPGLIRARVVTVAVATLSFALNAYWRAVRHWIG